MKRNGMCIPPSLIQQKKLKNLERGVVGTHLRQSVQECKRKEEKRQKKRDTAMNMDSQGHWHANGKRSSNIVVYKSSKMAAVIYFYTKKAKCMKRACLQKWFKIKSSVMCFYLCVNDWRILSHFLHFNIILNILYTFNCYVW